MAPSFAQEALPSHLPLLLLGISEAAPFALVYTVRPFTDRDRVDVFLGLPATVASVFQPVRGGDFVRHSEIHPRWVRGWQLPGGDVGSHGMQLSAAHRGFVALSLAGGW